MKELDEDEIGGEKRNERRGRKAEGGTGEADSPQGRMGHERLRESSSAPVFNLRICQTVI